MDGRARLDVDEAMVLEALGDGDSDAIPRKSAKAQWRGHDAVLCFAPKNDDGSFGPAEYREDL